MFKFLTTSKKGYTLVELMIVLVLLSLGTYAVMNLVNVAYRSFDKSEERYIKQEAVKEVAKLLQSGTANVSSARTADIFSTSDVVPVSADASYSYLFATQSKDDEGNDNGYFLYCQNKNKDRSSAQKLSDTPIYVEIKPYFETITKEDSNKNKYIVVQQYNAVTIELSALEDDYDYASGNPPTSDDKFYTLDVAYHFPNMATSNEYCMINHITRDEYAKAKTFDQTSGIATGSEQTAIHCEEEKCSYGHCGCYDESQTCQQCTACNCPGAKGLVLRVYCDSIISPDNTESAISVPSMCFVATASYGLDSGEVGALCAFRDECLKQSALGRAFINAYYTISPPIADFIRESEPLKAIVRASLKPLIVVSEYALNEDIRAEGMASLAVFMVCGATATAIIMKVDINRKRIKHNNK